MSISRRPDSPAPHDHLDIDEDSLDPRFPPEIEYQVFLISYDCNKKERTNLLRVARRVRDWLIPELYSTLIFSKVNNYGPDIHAIKRYGPHVQQVLFVVDPGSINESGIFKHCLNIHNLGFWAGGNPNPDIFRLKNLKRLLLRDMSFFGETHIQAQAIGEDAPSQTDIREWYANITHIATHQPPDLKSANIFLKFPNLSHVMILATTRPPVLEHILRSLPKLKVLVWLDVHILHQEDATVLDRSLEGAPQTGDDRVVWVNGSYRVDWIKSATGERAEDIWRIAEKVVEERKRERTKKL